MIPKLKSFSRRMLGLSQEFELYLVQRGFFREHKAQQNDSIEKRNRGMDTFLDNLYDIYQSTVIAYTVER